MTFLTPLMAGIAAAVAVPLLVLLYFLKLRRQQMVISSTLLWKRAVQDLQVNAPFQRIRRNILLLLQLLALAAILLALAGPMMNLSAGQAKRYVILIDRSASMNATDVSPNRLAEAKKQARQLVESFRSRTNFGLQDTSDQAMVIAFDQHAKVMCNFSSDKKQLLAAIESITPTDAPTSLAEALSVARAFAQSPGVEANNRSAESLAQLELFSDGQIADLDQVVSGEGEMNYHKIGSAGKNIAVTAMQARRNYEKANEVEVFATLANYDSAPATADVQLSIDGNVKLVRTVQLPAKRAPSAKDAGGPGTAAVSFSLTQAEGAVVEVRQLQADSLKEDDAAWSILPPPRRLSALLVSPGNVALETALKSCPLAGLQTMSPAEFLALDPNKLYPNSKYDVIILDRCSPDKLPPGRYIVFGVPPEASGLKTQGPLTNQVFLDWRGRHPVLQYVHLGNIFATKATKIVAPSDAAVLAEMSNTPGLVLVSRAGSTFLVAPFDVLDSNWPFEPGFVMFCYNAIAYLGLEVSAQQRTELAVGEPISLEGLPAGASAQVAGPGEPEAKVAVSPGGSLRLANTLRTGVYTVQCPPQGPWRFAVNLLDARESDIAPAEGLSLSGQTVAASEVIRPHNIELWPLLAAAAFVLVCVEWLIYNLKMRI